MVPNRSRPLESLTPREPSRGRQPLYPTIPVFPRFKILDLEDQDCVEGFVRSYSPYSDFNFLNLFGYGGLGGFRISLLNGNLVVRFTDYLTHAPFYSFLGSQAVLDTVDRLVDMAGSEGLTKELRLVPEDSILSAIEHIQSRFSVSEDPADSDYILASMSVATLECGSRHRRRKLVAALTKSFPSLRLVMLDIGMADVQQQLRSLSDKWQRKKARAKQDTVSEILAIDRLMRFSASFSLVCVGAYLGTDLVGFTINETLHSGYYMGHFGKADPDIPGFSVYLESQTAKVMAELGCAFMNYQQDLGIPGLRKYKESWHPVSRLRKYKVRLRDG